MTKGGKASNLAEHAARAALKSAKRAGDKAEEMAKKALKGLIGGNKDVLKKKKTIDSLGWQLHN